MALMNVTYIEPSYGAGSFTCPHCEAITGQRWGNPLSPTGVGTDAVEWSLCQSDACGRIALWVGILKTEREGTQSRNVLEGAKLVWPPVKKGPAPNPDLDGDIQKDFQEARSVLPHSPRAAAALLRLGLQKLMKQLGEPGKSINNDIGALVKKGLRPDVQQAADVVRVTGNEAVHPGTINTDDEGTVLSLFDLLNIIAEDRISQPAKVKAIYEKLPQDKKDGVADRDSAP